MLINLILSLSIYKKKQNLCFFSLQMKELKFASMKGMDTSSYHESIRRLEGEISALKSHVWGAAKTAQVSTNHPANRRDMRDWRVKTFTFKLSKATQVSMLDWHSCLVGLSFKPHVACLFTVCCRYCTTSLPKLQSCSSPKCSFHFLGSIPYTDWMLAIIRNWFIPLHSDQSAALFSIFAELAWGQNSMRSVEYAILCQHQWRDLFLKQCQFHKPLNRSFFFYCNQVCFGCS